MSDNLQPLPVMAQLLGYGGLIPFAGLSCAIAFAVDLSAIGIQSNTDALLAYAAVIVSFIGAVHWGVALSGRGKQALHYLYSVVPALFAWLCLLMPQKAGLAGMAALIVIAYLVDRALLFDELRSRYQVLRLHLSAVAAISLLVAAVML